MFRDIKFRAWDIKRKSMWLPDTYFDKSGAWNLLLTLPSGDKIQAGLDRFLQPYVGDEVVLMEFTGLLDVKGNEIYEGDILTTARGICLVRFNHGMYVAKYRGKSTLKPICRDVLKPIEIIGNIYQEPELLNG